MSLPFGLKISGLVVALFTTVFMGCSHFVNCSDCDSDPCDKSLTKLHKPNSGMHQLAKAVTRLEEDIDRCGSIVIKKPDIYGETNLMAYIQEYEREMKKDVSNFAETVQTYIAQSDASVLSSNTAIGAGQQKSTTAASETKVTGANPSTTTNTGTTTIVIPSPFSASTNPPVLPTLENPTTATATTEGTGKGVFDALKQIATEATKTRLAANAGVSVEPTQVERQKSTFIKVNQGLRRINMGDDNSRSAGNALYLMRIPVSIMPGRRTHEGYSAKVTMQAKMVLDENHLDDTFPRLVIGELAQVLQELMLTHWEAGAFPADSNTNTVRANKSTANLPGFVKSSIGAFLKSLEATDFVVLKDEFNKTRSQGQQAGMPKAQELYDFLFELFSDAHWRFKLNSSYMAMFNNWAIIQRQIIQSAKISPTGILSSSAVRDRLFFTMTSLFNFELNKALYRGVNGTSHAFFYSQGDPTAKATWQAFILREFPVHVVTVDPAVEEQNVFDAFSRRREIQLALAVALANGKVRGDQALKYSRLLAMDQTTIALNRTVVGFMHDNDTFGFVFRPRVQSPRIESSNIEAIARTLWATGPTRKYDLKHRELEPGIRECEVLVVMPGFVPNLRLDVTTNWERVAEPGKQKLEYDDMIDLGAKVLEVKRLADCVHDQNCYREGDYERLVHRIDQLEKALPLQTHMIKVPYEYDLPGGELFDTGTKHLRPSVTGFYGLHYLSKEDDAELFLTGSNFHPTQTHVIAGGKESHTLADNTTVEILSRQLLKVILRKVSTNFSNNPVELRVSTPAGVSNNMEIPFKDVVVKPKGFSFDVNRPLKAEYTLKQAVDKENKPTGKFKHDEATVKTIQLTPTITLLDAPTPKTATVDVQFIFGPDSKGMALTNSKTYKFTVKDGILTLQDDAVTLAKHLLIDLLPEKGGTDEGANLSQFIAGFKQFASVKAYVKYEDTAGKLVNIEVNNSMEVYLLRTWP